MNFINPSFLWALFALSIPILIHLFHFRRYKTVLFSNVKFLKEVKQERNNIRQLKRWLLLLSRLLALFFMVMAFTQPFLKGQNEAVNKSNAVSIYVDNSYSMGLKYKGVELIQWAKERGRDIINNYDNEDEFMILTNEVSVDEQRWKSKEDAINYLENIEITSNSVLFDKVINKQSYLFTKSESNQLQNYLISDFQTSSLNGATIESDSLESTYLVHLEADNIKNVYVDSVWMEDPVNVIGSNNSVLYKIKNSSELDAKAVRVTLKINEQVQAIRELNLLSEEVLIDTLYFNVLKEGWQLGEILIADYPITIDDEFYFSFNVEKEREVLEVFDGQTSSTIRSIFEGDDLIQLTRNQSSRLDYSSFSNYHLIVLNELEQVSSGLANSIDNYVESGGSVLLIPSRSANEGTYKNLLSAFSGIAISAPKTGNYRLLKPNFSSSLLKDIVEKYPSNASLPNVKKYFPVISSSRVREEAILKLNNNDPLLTLFPTGEGNLFVQTVPNHSDFSELQSHWSYAPVIYNMSLMKGLGSKLFLVNGEDEWLTIDKKIERNDNVVSLVGEEMEFIPEQRIVDNRLILNASKNENVPAGHFKVETNNNLLAWLSFNTSRLESEMKFANAERLKELFPEAEEIVNGTQNELIGSIKLKNDGRPLWRYCIILSLLFLISEVAIIKLLPD